jgi:hypothetical protein
MKKKLFIILTVQILAYEALDNNIFGQITAQVNKNQTILELIRTQMEQSEAKYFANMPVKSSNANNKLLDSVVTYNYIQPTDSFLSKRTLYSYNPLSKCTLKLEYTWYEELKKTFQNKYEFQYDSLGHASTISSDEWQIAHIPARYDTYTGKLLLPDTILYNNNLGKTILKYKPNGKLSSESQYTIDNSYPFYVNSYAYDTLDRKAFMNRNYGDYQKEYFQFDTLENITSYTCKTWEYLTAIWLVTNKIKYDYKFNTENKPDEVTSYYWSYNSNEWKAVSKANYTYRSNGKPLTKTYFIFDSASNALQQVDKTDYLYDGVNNLSIESLNAWDKTTNQWVLKNRKIYYYNYTFATSINTSNNTSVQIYPNPARNELYINADNSLPGEFRLYNLNGKLMKLIKIENGINKVNISGLKSGIYCIQVQTTKGVVSSKLVIE